MNKDYEDVVMKILSSKKTPEELAVFSGKLKNAARHRRIHVRFSDTMGDFFESVAAYARAHSLIVWATGVHDRPDRFSATDHMLAKKIAQTVKSATLQDAFTAPDKISPRASIAKRRW